MLWWAFTDFGQVVCLDVFRMLRIVVLFAILYFKDTTVDLVSLCMYVV